MQRVSGKRLGKHTSPQTQCRHNATVISYHVICVFCVVCSRTVFSAFSVSRLYNTSPLAAEESFRWVPRFEGDWTRIGKKTSWRVEVLVSMLMSVARTRLVETENPGPCETVNCKLCKSAIALYHPIWNPLFWSLILPYTWQYQKSSLFPQCICGFCISFAKR
jgi:hypothetical protein